MMGSKKYAQAPSGESPSPDDKRFKVKVGLYENQ